MQCEPDEIFVDRPSGLAGDLMRGRNLCVKTTACDDAPDSLMRLEDFLAGPCGCAKQQRVDVELPLKGIAGLLAAVGNATT